MLEPQSISKRINFKHLSVIKRGQSYRLKAPEGTYSYYHPEHLFTGLGWDAQTASLLLLDRAIGSILILGLGCGTVARQCRALFPNARIVGVEVNSAVIGLAYKSFALKPLQLEVLQSTGQRYLATANEKFDAIIDDMWLPATSESKPVLLDPNWSRLVRSRLNREAMYAVNLYSRGESRFEVRTAVARLRDGFSQLREVMPGPGQTTVIAAGAKLLSARDVRFKLRKLPNRYGRELSHVRFRTVRYQEVTRCFA